MPQPQSIEIRPPHPSDGPSMYSIADDTRRMNANPEYAYMLMGRHFSDTCAIAEIGGKVAGFIIGYIPPRQRNVLFLWHIGVHREYRQRGIAYKMLHDILARPACADVQYTHASIVPSNKPSRALFQKLADLYNTELHEQPFFPADYFEDQEEDEPLIIVGPFGKESL